VKVKLCPKMVGHLQAIQKKYTLKSTDVSVFLDVRNTSSYENTLKTDERCVKLADDMQKLEIFIKKKIKLSVVDVSLS
jgi:hypothetical protein